MGNKLSAHENTEIPVPGSLTSVNCDFCNEIQKNSEDSKGPQLSSRGIKILSTAAVLTGVFYSIAVPFVMPGFRKVCLPYVPATQQQIENVIRCLKGRTGTCIDLGSGDGRIVLELAKQSGRNNSVQLTDVHGVELNPWLVWYSQYKASRNGQSEIVKFARQNIFRTDLKKYNNIVVFGVEQLMVELEQKLKSELCDDGLVLACRFPFPNWSPCKIEGKGIDKVWVYHKSSNI